MPVTNEDIVQDMFEQWKQHPVTHQLVKNIDRQIQAINAKFISSAGDFEKSSEYFRLQAQNLKDWNTIREMILDYNVFSVNFRKPKEK